MASIPKVMIIKHTNFKIIGYNQHSVINLKYVFKSCYVINILIVVHICIIYIFGVGEDDSINCLIFIFK